MINQRLYPDILLGNSTLSIATDGCYLTAIAAGLLKKGYTYSVIELNDLFKDRGVFSHKSALLSAETIQSKVPDIFEYGDNESWNDANLVKYLNDPSYFVVGEVSGRGIGGSGQHFVLIDSVTVKPNGKISMTYVDDPWGGLEDQKVTNRYNNFGNILSLRVFKVKVKENTMPNMYKGYDLSNADSMKVAVDILVRLQSGDLIDRAKHEADLNKLRSEAQREKDQIYQEAFNKGKQEGQNGGGALPQTLSLPDGSVWEIKDLSYTAGPITGSYERKT